MLLFDINSLYVLFYRTFLFYEVKITQIAFQILLPESPNFCWRTLKIYQKKNYGIFSDLLLVVIFVLYFYLFENIFISLSNLKDILLNKNIFSMLKLDNCSCYMSFHCWLADKMSAEKLTNHLTVDSLWS